MKNIAAILFIQSLLFQTSWARNAKEGPTYMNRSQDVFDGRGENKYNQELQEQEQNRLKETQRIQKQEAELKKDRLKKKIHQKSP